MANNTDHKGRYAYDGLVRIMHEKARLGILTSLLVKNEGLLFGDLKNLCDLTDGNLNRHLNALETENLIVVTKSFYNRRPQTHYQLSEEGKQRFIQYLNELHKVLNDNSPYFSAY